LRLWRLRGAKENDFVKYFNQLVKRKTEAHPINFPGVSLEKSGHVFLEDLNIQTELICLEVKKHL